MTRTETNWLHKEIPSLFAIERLGFEPDDWQKELLDSDRRNIIILASRQSGKTKTTGIKLAHHALFYPGSLSLAVSGTLRQSGILQREVVESIRSANSGWKIIGQAEVPFGDDDTQFLHQSVLQLELANGSRVISCPGSPDSLRGFSPTGILAIDEASRCRDAVFDAVSPMRAVTGCQLIVASTPNGNRGQFCKLWKGADPAEWLKIRIDANDCPRISPEFLEKEKWRMSSEAMWRQEYYCEFVALAGALFSPDDIAAMIVTDGPEAWTLPSVAGSSGADVWRKTMLTKELGESWD